MHFFIFFIFLHIFTNFKAEKSMKYQIEKSEKKKYLDAFVNIYT